MEHRNKMNIVIVGHVDHGKSTVIGRLLADTGSLPEGKLDAVKAYCERNARPFEYAFLLDALKDEQAQGITIDTARSFFKTRKRDYIIIDAPGHVEFLKNMVTGASRAEAALLVIDAFEGIKENSKRHGHIVSMLGIQQVVVLVNKMDLVKHSQEAYEAIVSDFSAFLHKINIAPINFIPISAINGDNIADRSNNTPWFKGPTVLEQLDAFNDKTADLDLPFRLPVQDIYKFTESRDDRRIVAGTILSGQISENDEIVFLPSGKRSTVEQIERFNVPIRTSASAGEAIGLTLKTQIYIRPGELIVKANEIQPSVSSRFRTNLFWVGKAPLIKNRKYKLKLGTMQVPVKLIEILNMIDAAELNIDTYKDQVERHDVAECIFETAKPVTFDPISVFEQTGRFVIVDSYEIAGGGIILESLSDQKSSLQEEIKKREFQWEKSLIGATERFSTYGHRSKFVVLTTGQEDLKLKLQEIGRELERSLFNRTFKAYFLGVPSLLNGLGADEISNYENREEHIRMIGGLARILTDSGQIFITTIFNLDDYEVEKLKLLNHPYDILVISVGESPFVNYVPDLTTDLANAVDETCTILKNKDVYIDFTI